MKFAVLRIFIGIGNAQFNTLLYILAIGYCYCLWLLSVEFFSLHGVPQRRFAGRRRFYRGVADCINKYSAMRGRISFTACKVLPVFHLHFIILSASPQYAMDLHTATFSSAHRCIVKHELWHEKRFFKPVAPSLRWWFKLVVSWQCRTPLSRCKMMFSLTLICQRHTS